MAGWVWWWTWWWRRWVTAYACPSLFAHWNVGNGAVVRQIPLRQKAARGADGPGGVVRVALAVDLGVAKLGGFCGRAIYVCTIVCAVDQVATKTVVAIGSKWANVKVRAFAAIVTVAVRSIVYEPYRATHVGPSATSVETDVARWRKGWPLWWRAGRWRRRRRRQAWWGQGW